MCIILRNLTESYELSEVALMASLLHDIGYSERLSIEGFHPYDGYVFLLSKGYLSEIAEIVLFHSYAKELSVEQSIRITTLYESIKLSRPQKRVIELLNYCDFQTSPTGVEVSFDKRLEDIKVRLGEDSLPYSVLYSNRLDILDSISKVYSDMSEHPLFFL